MSFVVGKAFFQVLQESKQNPPPFKASLKSKKVN